MIRKYGVDVSSFQPSNTKEFRKVGSSFVIVKLTEGLGYINPKAQRQVISSRANHMYVNAYHFANFGNSATQAVNEAKYFISWAKKIGISKKRVLWLDWEQSANNNTNGGKNNNTTAIMAFMSTVEKAGWKAGLYSGSYLLKSAIDISKIGKRFGPCLWVASYPTTNAVSKADFRYFPSMDYVALWQFTNNWKGLNVDGNVAVTKLYKGVV